MTRRQLAARFFLVASLLTAALIFYFSAQKGVDSQSLSDGITLRVAKLIRPDYTTLPRQAQISYLEMLSTLVRKNAHFCEFALLGFNLLCYLRLRDPAAPPRACRLQAWIIATLYAVTDEVHQMFISERSPQMLDVLIDSAGGLAGALFATLCLAAVLRHLHRSAP